MAPTRPEGVPQRPPDLLTKAVPTDEDAKLPGLFQHVPGKFSQSFPDPGPKVCQERASVHPQHTSQQPSHQPIPSRKGSWFAPNTPPPRPDYYPALRRPAQNKPLAQGDAVRKNDLSLSMFRHFPARNQCISRLPPVWNPPAPRNLDFRLADRFRLVGIPSPVQNKPVERSDPVLQTLTAGLKTAVSSKNIPSPTTASAPRLLRNTHTAPV